MLSEKNGDGRPLNTPGLYRHPETGSEVWLDAQPGLGTPMVDAFKKAGYVLVEGATRETEAQKVVSTPKTTK